MVPITMMVQLQRRMEARRGSLSFSVSLRGSVTE